MSGLSRFQAEVSTTFFSLQASAGFLLAGGGALLASGLTSRPTVDLDFFGDRERAKIADAANEFEAAAAERGWIVERVQIATTFIRLRVVGEEELIVDRRVPRDRRSAQHRTAPAPSWRVDRQIDETRRPLRSCRGPRLRRRLRAR